MAKKQADEDVPMTALNADISTQSMDLLKLAKVVHKRPIRDLVQEAIDEWLKRHGITHVPQPKEPRRN